MGRIFAFGVQSVGNMLGREIDDGIAPSNNRRHVSFLIARAKSFTLWMSRMKVCPKSLHGYASPEFQELRLDPGAPAIHSWNLEARHSFVRSSTEASR